MDRPYHVICHFILCLLSLSHFLFPLHHHFHNKVCVCVCVYCNLKTNVTQLINGWTLKIGAGCCQLMEQWNVRSHWISLQFVDHPVADALASTVVAQLIKFPAFCGVWRFISFYIGLFPEPDSFFHLFLGLPQYLLIGFSVTDCCAFLT
jgi:hypothetical protein